MAGDTLNITCNFLYCNHQVHSGFLITLYNISICVMLKIESLVKCVNSWPAHHTYLTRNYICGHYTFRYQISKWKCQNISRGTVRRWSIPTCLLEGSAGDVWYFSRGKRIPYTKLNWVKILHEELNWMFSGTAQFCHQVCYLSVSSVCLLVCVTVVDKNKAVVCCLLATSVIMLSEKKKRKLKMWSKK
jgi:hypothetical protein